MAKPNGKTLERLRRIHELYQEDAAITQKEICAVLSEEFEISPSRGRELIIQYRESPAEFSSFPVAKRAEVDVQQVSSVALPASWDEAASWVQENIFSPAQYAMTLQRLLELRDSQSDVAAMNAIKTYNDMLKENRSFDGKPEEVLINRISIDDD